MGLIVDTGIFIRAERDGHRDPTALIPGGEELGFSVITLSELLEGVHLANSPARAARRTEYIERLKKFMSIMPFDGQAVEVHAKLRATQRMRGKMIGAHDLIIAATAISLGWDVLTLNGSEFRQIEGLGVREP